jgi:hypothetical protein
MKNNVVYTKGRTDEDGRIVIDGMFLEPDCEVDIAISVSDNRFSVAVFPSEEMGEDGCIFCPYCSEKEEE